MKLGDTCNSLSSLGSWETQRGPPRRLPIPLPVPATGCRLSRSQAPAAAPRKSLAANRASLGGHRWFCRGSAGPDGSVGDRRTPIELRVKPRRDVGDLRARRRIALTSVLRARTPGRIRHRTHYQKRLFVSDRLRVLAAVQPPDPRVALSQRFSSHRRPAHSDSLHAAGVPGKAVAVERAA